ncbi:MAG: CsbD family protein [Synechococcaceae cyanobacterium]
MQLNLNSIMRRLQAVAISFLAPIAIMSSLMLSLQPAMAMDSHPSLTTTTFATMSNKSDAAAKDAEGKLESAYGDLTDDKGHQLKGKAKQVQASAMNIGEDVKDAARAAGQKIADATGQK